ncbi:hypothetical protein ARMGADRAFT_989920 [Armillaria gallica]|uniref:Nucleotidyltransferase n=1 Tax=Armillaria gallica TaxID=47427 RepID=A0A2H3DLI1_ARMGA|nr:hypothetical protein ARMGADRAFT_989920 [Armillaria gallica]
MDNEQHFSGLAILSQWIPDDADDRQGTRRSQSSSSLPPKSRTSLSVATTSASPVIPTRGFRAVVFRAAREVIRIFREAECTFAILGSTVCYINGNDRLPNDVDILMSSHTCKPEWLKEFLVTKNPDRFYLVDAKTPGATWKPGILQLPMIFSEAIVDKQGLPVVPMSILLLHKFKGWEDHMKSAEPRLRSKHDADVGDICSLLRIVIGGMNMQEKKNSTHWKQFALERFGEEFRDETERRVNLFCWKYPAYCDMWQKLGW